MWKAILVIVLLAAGVLVAIFVYKTEKQASASAVTCASLTDKPVVAAFGDSLVAGYGAQDQQGFVGPLSKTTGISILNNGIDGNTTADASARISEVLNEKPNIVILLLGGNDALQQVPAATTKSNLQSIITQLQKHHVIVVLVGVLGGFPSDPFKPMFESLASTNNVLYVPNILNGLITNSKYMYDQVHPNSAGYDIAAQKILLALNQACAEFSQARANHSLVYSYYGG